SDDVARGKPAPDGSVAAAARLGADAARCLVVEDSLNGVRAGKAAGMFVVLVPNATVPPAGNARELADVVLPSLAQLDPATLAAPGPD
ncbi:MAG: HAD-IA family hydrolase, partial [Chloroflexota bacterium]